MDHTSMYRYLTYAGTLPFIACAVLPFAGYPAVPGLGACIDIAAAYGLAIASFMAGAHWGLFLATEKPSPINLFVTSNLVTLAAWLAFLIGPRSLTLAVLGGAFIFLLYVDYVLRQRQILTPLYLRTRLHATVIVVLSLIASLFAA